ncbi:hypothetical protein ACFFLM_14785 [Deinococcus oregonensis]|uniref:Uncharacterized protein n=1 Tax=Deinococcus oregonensis TaxID=1805970 RepID=A0ABV6B2Y6_9DEIO
MPSYQVGQPYQLGATSCPEDLHVLGLSGQRMEVLVSLPAPTSSEETAFHTAPLYLGLIPFRSVVILLMRLPGMMDWSDAAFDLRRMQPEEQTLPAVGETGITFLLVDANTGLVRGVRSGTVSARFIGVLHELLEAQSWEPYWAEQYERDVRNSQNCSSAQLAVGAFITEQVGFIEVPVKAENEGEAH